MALVPDDPTAEVIDSRTVAVPPGDKTVDVVSAVQLHPTGTDAESAKLADGHEALLLFVTWTL